MELFQVLAKVILFFAAFTPNFEKFVDGASRITDDKWETRRCANLNPYVDGNTIILIAEQNSKWNIDKFCHALRKNMKVSGEYEMSVDFLWGSGGKYPGLIFNMWDKCNYDWIYKQMTGKYVFGHVKDCHALSYGNNAGFPIDPITPANKWYELKIKVRSNKNVRIYLNNVYKGNFQAYFNTRGFGGVAIANGYLTTMKFMNFQIAPKN